MWQVYLAGGGAATVAGTTFVVLSYQDDVPGEMVFRFAGFCLLVVAVLLFVIAGYDKAERPPPWAGRDRPRPVRRLLRSLRDRLELWYPSLEVRRVKREAETNGRPIIGESNHKWGCPYCYKFASFLGEQKCKSCGAIRDGDVAFPPDGWEPDIVPRAEFEKD